MDREILQRTRRTIHQESTRNNLHVQQNTTTYDANADSEESEKIAR